MRHGICVPGDTGTTSLSDTRETRSRGAGGKLERLDSGAARMRLLCRLRVWSIPLSSLGICCSTRGQKRAGKRQGDRGQPTGFPSSWHSLCLAEKVKRRRSLTGDPLVGRRSWNRWPATRQQPLWTLAVPPALRSRNTRSPAGRPLLSACSAGALLPRKSRVACPRHTPLAPARPQPHPAPHQAVWAGPLRSAPSPAPRAGSREEGSLPSPASVDLDRDGVQRAAQIWCRWCDRGAAQAEACSPLRVETT